MTQGDVFQAIESIQMDRDISGLNFSPAVPSLLLSSAWDASLTLHDISRNLCVNSWTFEAPLLDCHFSLDGNLAYTAGLGRVVKEYETYAKGNACAHCIYIYMTEWIFKLVK